MKHDRYNFELDDQPELTMSDVRDRHDRMTANGRGPTREHRDRLNSEKGPFKPPPDRALLRDNGMDMRMIAKEKHPTREGALKRAMQMPWWSEVVDGKPYHLARHWIWIVKSNQQDARRPTPLE